MRPGLTSLVSFPPGSTGAGVHLGTLGHVSPPKYSFTVPGGCEKLTAALRRPATFRHDALRPGRRLEAMRGGSVVWAGILDEPAPTDDGWQISAHGAAGLATDYRAVYTPPWDSGTPNDAVDQAITRGLDWIRQTNIGAVSGIWLGQKVDSAGQSIADLLTLVCHKGGLTWEVRTEPRGNVLRVFALPSSANRLLVATGLVPTSVTDGADHLFIRYQSAADTNRKPAVYSLTSVSNQPLIDATGRREDTLDISSGGVLNASGAQAVGNQVLKRFTRAAFTDPITIRYGDLLNTGAGVADPGVFYADGTAAMVCKLIMAEFGYGGEVTRGAVTFLVGAYEWDDATLVASVTPFESLRKDFSSLMSVVADTLAPRARPTHRRRAHR